MVMKYNCKAFTKTVLTKSSNSITIVHENFQIIKVLKNPLDPQTRKKITSQRTSRPQKENPL